MAALEHRILTQLLENGDLYPAIKAGLKEDEFRDPEAKNIWTYLKQHWFDPKTYHTLPTLMAVQRRYPSFRPTAYSEEKGATQALIKDLKDTVFESDLRSKISYYQEMVEHSSTNDMPAVAREMRLEINELLQRQGSSEEVGVSDIIKIGTDHYKEAKTGAIYGLSWPWKPLTDDTLGKNPGDFIVMYSRMKQMKTWLALYCAAHDYLVNKARVLIWSKEMNFKKSALRLASIFGKVDYQVFKKGLLPKPVLLRMKETFDEIMEMDRRSRETGEGPAIRLLTGKFAPVDLGAVTAIIQEFKPTVVYLDSFYHLRPEADTPRRYERIADLAEQVKLIAEEEEIPIIAIHQANRYGEKTHGKSMDDMADSDVIPREATLVIRIVKKKNEDLYEEDYEKWWEENEDEDVDLNQLFQGCAVAGKPRKRKIHFPGRRAEPKSVEPAESEAKTVGKPKKAWERDQRLGTKLGLIFSGNRDGTLETMVINAIPGYDFSFVSCDVSVKDIEGWLDEDGKKGPRAKPLHPKRPHDAEVKLDADAVHRLVQKSGEAETKGKKRLVNVRGGRRDSPKVPQQGEDQG